MTLEKGKEKEHEPQLGKDAQVKLLFGLTDNDTVLAKEFNCKWKDKILHSGTLYVFSNCACFYAKIFGFKTKRVVPYINITLLAKATGEKAEPELRINYTKGDKKEKQCLFRFSDREKFDEAYNLIGSLWNSVKKLTRERTITQLVLPKRDKNELTTLTKADWDLILKDAKLIKFSKNDIIIQEGDRFQRIFQVASGSCRVEKKKDDGSIVLGSISTSQTFGEISFLQGEGATASVIANEENVEIYVIEGYIISNLFDGNPGFGGRFFKYLAFTVNNRLRVREGEIVKD